MQIGNGVMVDCIKRLGFTFTCKNVLKDRLEHFDSKLTEIENMTNNGWNRIWDCGNHVFVKHFNNELYNTY